jgi:hypothetical protein
MPSTRKRRSFQITGRFFEGTAIATFFDWYKLFFKEDLWEFTSRALKTIYWPVYLSHKGASPEVVATARREALTRCGELIDELLASGNDAVPLDDAPSVHAVNFDDNNPF